jgi:hypothetical protein
MAALVAPFRAADSTRHVIDCGSLFSDDYCDHCGILFDENTSNAERLSRAVVANVKRNI